MSDEQALIYNALLAHRSNLLTAVAEALSYNWSDEFKLERINEASSKATRHDLSKLSLAQLDSLGFPKWDEKQFRLVPLWANACLAYGTTMLGIDGRYAKYSLTTDLDHRFGAMAIGIVPVDSNLRPEHDIAALKLAVPKPVDPILGTSNSALPCGTDAASVSGVSPLCASTEVTAANGSGSMSTGATAITSN